MVRIIILMMLFLSGCREGSRERSKEQKVYQILQSMPEEDRQILDAFFQLLIRDNNFSYTLFGNKPVSIADYYGNDCSFYLYDPLSYLTYEKGWETWSKYSHYFRNSNYRLLKTVIGDTVEIAMVNVNQISHLKDKYKNYQDKLNKIITIGLYKIDNQSLMGVVLGYGEENAKNFERKMNLCRLVNQWTDFPYAYDDLLDVLDLKGQWLILKVKGASTLKMEDYTRPSQKILLAKELNEMIAQEDGFELSGSDYFLDRFISPPFMALKDTVETKRLEKDYFETKQKVNAIYQKGSFLEITLKQMMSAQ